MTATSPMPAADATSAPTTLVVRPDPRTGKLVRRPEPTPARPPASVTIAKPKPVKPEISNIVAQAAKVHSIDPLLVHAVIGVESNYDESAVSPKGAEGLMQLMPSTARMLGVTNSFDPRQNIEAGVRYLKQLKEIYQDDTLALAAYNAGPKAVDKFKSVPPYKETQNYVDRVGRRYEAARQSIAPVKKDVNTADAPAAAPPQEEEPHRKLEQFVDANGRFSLRTATP